jgi:hypothetical protein
VEIPWDKIATFLTNNGFSAVVALWFMLRLEKKLDALILSAQTVNTSILESLKQGGFHGKNPSS